MMVSGFVVNSTGKSKHIFKRTVYPGQKIKLEDVYSLVKRRVPEEGAFLEWLEEYLPSGWEIEVEEGKTVQKEVLTAEITVHDSPDSQEVAQHKETAVVEVPSLKGAEYLRPKDIRELTAKQIYELQIKDNPKRILKHVDSIHKLRRALTLCKQDNRKATLTRLIQGRIRQLNITL